MRLKMAICAAPSSAACTVIAVAAPPVPRITILCPLTSTPCSFRFLTNPSPVRIMAGQRTILFHDDRIAGADQLRRRRKPVPPAGRLCLARHRHIKSHLRAACGALRSHRRPLLRHVKGPDRPRRSPAARNCNCAWRASPNARPENRSGRIILYVVDS